jgi:uncharacterized protein (TIGR03118 family)
MNKKLTLIGLKQGANSLLTVSVLALSFGCHKSNVDNKDLKDFQVVNLVSNEKEEYNAQFEDKTLINGFGLAWSPNGSTAWVNSVGGHVSELYSQAGVRIKGVTIPTSATDTTDGFPCGIVFAGGQGFRLGAGTATFIFTSFEGVLSAWNGGNHAQFLKHPAGASYTGLAIGASNGRNLIYGANFGLKRIDVWDTAFALVHFASDAFTDHSIPDTYSPYNIQAAGNYLFVMYDELSTYDDQTKGHPVNGAGKGFVDVFSMEGVLLNKFASRGTLNAPWGMTIAPGSFLAEQDMTTESKTSQSSQSNVSYGSNGHRDPKDSVVLIGNFGDGRINVFSQDAKYLGQLQTHKNPISIEGLWALSFAPGNTTKLFFTAGPDKENDGVFGYLIKQ